jgi:DNA-3-methyladenine glycosylase
MYYARGSDSLNFSVGEPGDAVLIKSAYPAEEQMSAAALRLMQTNNPGPRGPRPASKLCAGQTLLCKSLGLKVKDWNGKALVPNQFELKSDDYEPSMIIQCRRLGIPEGRDEHLPHRYVDAAYAKHCTSNPLTKRDWREGRDYYRLLSPSVV